MNRRIFLRGTGGACLAAPFLSSLGKKAGAQETPPPRRLVVFYTNNGVLTNRWFPKTDNGTLDAAALAGTELEGLTPFADKLLCPRGFGMFPNGSYTVNGATWFDPHDQGMGSKMTCAPIDPAGSHYALSHSLDWEVARAVNPGGKDPLVLSVGTFFANVKYYLSYKASGQPVAPTTSPKTVYSGLTGLFTSGDAQPTEGDWRVKRGQSVIDLVKGDLETLARLNMSGADKQKLDQWLSLLRETEIPAVSAACNAEALGITDAAVSEASANSFDQAKAFTLGGDMMLKLIVLTMMCDANRSIVLHWPGIVTFTWDGMNHDYDHHGLSHRVGSAAVQGSCVPNVIESLAQIDAWYASRYVRLVDMISKVSEGDASMLDNSAVMWLPEIADGLMHNQNNLPIMIAGSAGGYLKQGVAVNVEGKTLQTGNSEATCTDPAGGQTVEYINGSNGGWTPLNKLYVTLLNAVGARTANDEPYTSFGLWDTNKEGDGITKPGEVDALKASG